MDNHRQNVNAPRLVKVVPIDVQQFTRVVGRSTSDYDVP